MKLGYPEYVVLLINPNAKAIAVKKCSAETPNSVSFYKNNDKNVLSVRWNAKDLLNTLQDITGWNLAIDAFRVDGTLLKEEEAMLFELDNAKVLK